MKGPWFPCLLNLKMKNLSNNDEALSSLPSGLDIGALILHTNCSRVSPEILLDVIPRTGAKLLGLDGWFYCNHHEGPELAKTFTGLHKNGLNIVCFGWDDVNVSNLWGRPSICRRLCLMTSARTLKGTFILPNSLYQLQLSGAQVIQGTTKCGDDS